MEHADTAQLAALGGALGAVLVLLAGAGRMGRLALLAVLVTAPLRPPLSFDSSSTFLVQIADDGRLGRLLPLYFVLAAAAMALGWRALRGGEVRPLPRPVALPAAVFF